MCCVLSESAQDFEYDGLFIRWFVDLPTGHYLSAAATITTTTITTTTTTTTTTLLLCVIFYSQLTFLLETSWEQTYN